MTAMDYTYSDQALPPTGVPRVVAKKSCWTCQHFRWLTHYMVWSGARWTYETAASHCYYTYNPTCIVPNITFTGTYHPQYFGDQYSRVVWNSGASCPDHAFDPDKYLTIRAHTPEITIRD